MPYQQVKQELSALVSSTRHFTRAWYKMYLSCLNKARENAENGIDDGYFDGHVYKLHAYDPVFESKFYNLNSGAYCEFLSVVNGRV